MKTVISIFILVTCCSALWPGCADPENKPLPYQTNDYIRKIEGKDEPVPAETIRRGEVLISYADCYTCHTTDKRSKGPAFRDIALRYPTNPPFIDMLARKVIAGGSGAWGAPVMDPHPQLGLEDAKAMVSYILSLR